MPQINHVVLAVACAFASGVVAPGKVHAVPSHGIAMYGEPALPPDFVSLPYAYPDAPKGGSITYGRSGSFDSLHPWIVKGRAPWEIRSHVYETLLGRSYDEPFTLYGLLAETVETGPDRDWVEFTLRPEARFSDGSPVTVEDLLWSFETLGTEGHPRYSLSWKKIESAMQTGERTVRFTFNTVDRELPLILGLRPVLQKSQWDGKGFGESSLDIPIGSGPYVVEEFEPGRFIRFARDTDYWGKDLSFNRGRHNFDKITYEYFGDGGVVFEAFKAGEIDIYREWNAAKWDSNYDFPAVRTNAVVKSEIYHQRPSGIRGFVFNTRREKFTDIRVRDALIHAFNFELTNAIMNDGKLPRIQSYFSNSVLGAKPGPATGKVLELLLPFKNEIPEDALEGYTLPVSDGSERNRKNILLARDLFQSAGWSIDTDGVLKNADGEAFEFEILVVQGAHDTMSIAEIYIESLKRLGIQAEITLVDSSQYQERTNAYDFDVAWYRRSMSLSPGNEQRLYWGREGVETPGTRNWMGVASDAVEAMIAAILEAREQSDFIAGVRALDRILTANRFVIPVWYSNFSRLAYKAELRFPESIPIYGDWIGFLPDVWWYEKPAAE
ncbi:MAG: extracellular solute-binding protein [Albidovulum sp.]|nr:extracellular solute-binding protein [Albidovulum sp.]MDE0532334.1 extracellular solute-binding protein [Albidovulum sp.]